MMARCFDVVQALDRYEVPENCPDGRVTVLLQDDLLEENNHLVTLTADNGCLYLENTAGDADTVIPMGAFAQLYFGAFSFSQLVESGKIRMRSYTPGLLSFLDALFPRCVNFINEYY
jgi:predicted acetyltransferase